MFNDKTIDGKALVLMLQLQSMASLTQLEKMRFKTRRDKLLISNIKECIKWCEDRAETI